MDVKAIMEDEGLSGEVVIAIEEVHYRDGGDVKIMRRCESCRVRVDDKTGVPIGGSHKSGCSYG